MLAYQKVVAGVHDSPSGARAVELAGLVAAATDAELILVAAYQDAGVGRAGTGAGSGQARGAVSVEQTLQRAAARCVELGGKSVHTFAAAGDPATVLDDAVRAHQADLLLVGSHGLATWHGRLLGSVPAAVSATASCDVLVAHTTPDRWRKLVNRRYRHRPGTALRTVVVGVHGTPRSIRAAEKAGTIAADLDAELVLVGSYEPAARSELALAGQALRDDSYLARGSEFIETALQDAAARAQANGARLIDQVVVDGPTVPGVLMIADQRRAELLVLGNHHLPGAAHLMGTISDRITRNAPTHVLLVH
jgi:nucleotide-binding universal stress UspA family protein